MIFNITNTTKKLIKLKIAKKKSTIITLTNLTTSKNSNKKQKFAIIISTNFLVLIKT